jgi:hypothetical protein
MTATERFDDSIRTIVRKDLVRERHSLERAEAGKDDAEIALKRLKIEQQATMEACRAVINDLAVFAGTKRADRLKALEVVAQELGEVTWDKQQELEREIERCESVIERAERPDGPVTL